MRHKTTMRLGDFIQKEIVIPCYQRGYIWGKKHSGTEHNAVTFILDSLKKEVEPERKKDLFIQGITVVDKGNSYVVIDGQQRMTFFYLLLKTLGDGAFSIRYTSSRGCADGGNNTPQQWLDNYSAASDVSKEDSDDEYQDVYYFKKTPEVFENSVDSEKSVTAYYREYFYEAGVEPTKYPSRSCETTLEELLGKNKPGRSQYVRKHGNREGMPRMSQAFATAGKEYKVIDEEAEATVVIPYDETAINAIDVLENTFASVADQKKAVRTLQQYSVGISEYLLKKLGRAVHKIDNMAVQVLSIDYYDRKEGVLEEPRNRFLNF